MKAILFGASGGLATALADSLLTRAWQVDLVSRAHKSGAIQQRFSAAIKDGNVNVFTVQQAYPEFEPKQSYDVCFFTQALFSPRPFVSMDDAAIEAEISVGLTGQIALTRKLLAMHPQKTEARRDFCYVGSTSAYVGFKNSAVYCAVKHGLLGFVRAMNDEYAQTDTRFWLFSMGTMNTEMGAALVDQDPASFLQPEDVAERMISSVTSPSNLFEPEVLMRRRTIRFWEKK